MKKMSSTIAGVIPWRISSAFSMELSEPISHMFNSALVSGILPDSWKHEQNTLVPKVYPPCYADDLSRISGTKILFKLLEVSFLIALYMT